MEEELDENRKKITDVIKTILSPCPILNFIGSLSVNSFYD